MPGVISYYGTNPFKRSPQTIRTVTDLICSVRSTNSLGWIIPPLFMMRKETERKSQWPPPRQPVTLLARLTFGIFTPSWASGSSNCPWRREAARGPTSPDSVNALCAWTFRVVVPARCHSTPRISTDRLRRDSLQQNTCVATLTITLFLARRRVLQIASSRPLQPRQFSLTDFHRVNCRQLSLI